MTVLATARADFHRDLLSNVLSVDSNGVPSNADSSNRASVAIASEMVRLLGASRVGNRLPGQTLGTQFEIACERFIRATFLQLGHLRPGGWHVETVPGRNANAIAQFAQYSHLIDLADAAEKDWKLAAALGNDYQISPDVVIYRDTEPDSVINQQGAFVGSGVATHASLRQANGGPPIMHASVSCKWSMRSDRAQNARSEALTFIRNRKGRLPHIVVITAEPTPSRLSSLALGTGDLDFVYHIALPELQAAVASIGQSEAEELLRIMVSGKRLRDISDLPLDLAV